MALVFVLLAGYLLAPPLGAQSKDASARRGEGFEQDPLLWFRELGGERGSLALLKMELTLSRCRDRALRGLDSELAVDAWNQASLAALEHEHADARLMAVKAVGLLALLGEMPGPRFVALARATEDDSRQVRREAVLQLATLRYADSDRVRSARKAMLRAWKGRSEDEDLGAVVKTGRDALARLLKNPANPARVAKIDGGPSRLRANEMSAIATLKNLLSAQAQAQASCAIDVDGDRSGEYGYLAELAGAALRSDEKGGVGELRVRPPVLSGSFRKVRAGVVLRAGYVFCIFLPGMDGRGVPEADAGGGEGCTVSAKHARTLWCAYAWPESYGTSGRRVYYVNQSGELLKAENATTCYEGSARGYRVSQDDDGRSLRAQPHRSRWQPLDAVRSRDPPAPQIVPYGARNELAVKGTPHSPRRWATTRRSCARSRCSQR